MNHKHYILIALVGGAAIGFFVTSLSTSGPGLTIWNAGYNQTMF